MRFKKMIRKNKYLQHQMMFKKMIRKNKQLLQKMLFKKKKIKKIKLKTYINYASILVPCVSVIQIANQKVSMLNVLLSEFK